MHLDIFQRECGKACIFGAPSQMSDKLIKSMAGDMPPYELGAEHGSKFFELQSVAVTVLVMVNGAQACERLELVPLCPLKKTLGEPNRLPIEHIFSLTLR